jgi:hypothetical protein
LFVYCNPAPLKTRGNTDAAIYPAMIFSTISTQLLMLKSKSDNPLDQTPV